MSLRQHLQALDAKGQLVFQSRGRGQSPHLELPLRATGVPVVGSIPAGSLQEALQEPEGYLPLKGGESFFALRVSGDSMADLIQDGDVVLFKKGAPVRSGEICAVRVGSSEATLKYLDWLDKKTVALRPHNPLYPTLSVARGRGADRGRVSGPGARQTGERVLRGGKPTIEKRDSHEDDKNRTYLNASDPRHPPRYTRALRLK